jgi:sarcosine oxidase subunit alpha
VADRRIAAFARGKPVTISLEGDPVRAYEGEPVAVALFASGVKVLSRSIKYHRPRTFFCLDGHCAACFMRIDGVPNVKGCRAPARDGTRCERQNALPSASFDLLGAADWLFPRGMDHHTLLARQPLLRPVLHKVVRELGGLGRLPDAPPAELPAVMRRHLEVLVVGGGPAGLSCAIAAARRGRKVLLVDENDQPGGSLFAEPGGSDRARQLTAQARAAGVELWSSATALAWFAEDEGGLLTVQTPTGLAKLSADRTVYATGTYDQNILCADNDRPGVVAARAVGRLLLRWGVRPGARIALVGPWSYADRLGPALEAQGIAVVRVPAAARIHGSTWVEWVELADGSRQDCDLCAACAPPLPASELARQHGAEVGGQDRAFAITVNDAGATSRPGVLACGDVTGPATPEVAATHGVQVGEQL